MSSTITFQSKPGRRTQFKKRIKARRKTPKEYLMAKYFNQNYKGQGTERCGMTCQKGESSKEQSMCCKESGKNTCPGYNNNACKKVRRKYINSYHQQTSREKQLKMAEYSNEKCKSQKTVHRCTNCQDEKSLEEQRTYCKIPSVKVKERSKETGYLIENGKR